MKEERKSTKLPTKAGLMIRLLVVAYIVYIIYSMRDVGSRYSGAELGFYIAVLVVFAICGLILAIFSIRDLLKGNYAGGAMDLEMEESSSEEENTNI